MSAETPPPASDPTHGSRDDRIEAVLFDCIEAADPAAAIEAAAQAEPEIAEPLRRAFGEMVRFDLLTTTAKPDATGGLGLAEGGVPERLDDYRLLDKLGAGGMGVVYLARDESLQRTVALKLIRPEHLYLPGARDRFQREVETIARLQHPGIVPIYGVGKSDGMPYFTMQHVRGCSLAQALTKLQGDAAKAAATAATPPDGRQLLDCTMRAAAPRDEPGAERATRATDTGSGSGSGSDSHGIDGLSWADTCVTIAIQIASALHHAHERGVVHRDVKPSNILLSHGARAMVVDFGLAWSDDADQRLTQSASQLGSLPYLPPEQLAGNAVDPSRAADVYSLGVTLYEMLARRHPFLGRNGEETRRNILDARPMRLRRTRSGVSWELETVCMTAMDPDPSKRYRTMLEFLRDLERVLARESILARRPSLARRIRRWSQRHPTLLAAASVALVAAIGGLSAFGMHQRKARLVADNLRELAETERYGALVSNADLELRAGQRPDRARRLLAECRDEHRGWEWRHLEFATDESSAVHSDFERPIQDIAWSANGEHYAISSQDHSLQLFDAEDQRLWRINSVRSSSVAFCHPEGEPLLLVGVLDEGLQLRNLEDGSLIAKIPLQQEGPRGELASLVVSPDGRRAYAAGSDGTLSLWDLQERTFVRTFGTHDAQAHRIAISPDGHRIASGGFDRKVMVFDADQLTPIAEWKLGGWCLGVAFAPDSRHVVASDSLTLLALDSNDPEATPKKLDRNANTVLAVASSPRGDTLAAAVSRRLLNLYRFEGGGDQELRIVPMARAIGHEGLLQQIAFSPDGETVLTGSSDQTVRAWRSGHSSRLKQKPHNRLVAAVLWTGHNELVSVDTRGNLVFSNDRGRFARIEETEGTAAIAAKPIALLDGQRDEDGSLQSFWSIDNAGQQICWQRRARGRDRESGPWHATETIERGGTPVEALWSRPGNDRAEDRSLVLAHADGRITVHGPISRTWQAHDEHITAIAAHGSTLWSADVLGKLRRWDLATGECIAEGPQHPEWIAALALAPDGSWLATSCADTAIRILDPQTGTIQRRLDGHGRAPLVLNSDRTGSRLISSGGFDAELRFWDPLSGRCLLSMACLEMAMAMSFDEHQQALAIGGRIGHVIRLRARPGGTRAFDARSVPIDTMTAPPGKGAQHR
ncbi:MAG: WD40 repeat domain-containing serine/threonine protein kinase [Planctomycetota bacterium]